MCRLIFHKDFTDVEKKLDIGVGLPNERGDSLVHYGIGGMWQYEDSNFMKYAVEIRTPYRSVGKIKCSIQYEHDQHKDISYLEAYLQYSNSTVLTATSELDGKSIKFNIDSTYETNKKIIIKGSFTNRGDRRNFDAVLSSDKEYKLVGWATVLPEHPIMLEVKLYKTKDDTKELLGGVINIVKVPGGYEMKTLIRKSGHHINVECEFMQLGDQGKQFHIMVATNYPGYESLIFDTILLNSNFELMMAKINASIKSKFLTTDLKLNANISLKNDAGLFNLLLTTPKISTDAKITWVFNWLEYLLLNFNGKLDYDNMTKELMSKFHFWNLNSKYDKISFGANINYNRKFWWLCTNGTLLWPNWKDLQLAVFIIVPDSGQLPAHRVLAKFKYLNDFSYFTHLIDYISHSTKFDFRTLSKVISSSPYIKGAFLVKTGRHRIFDNFSIKNSDEIYNIWNLLQSTNMKHDLLLEIQYKNFKPTQFVNLVLYYPKPTDLVTADLEFTSIKNLYARMNCSTPFKAFPEIKSYLNIVTNKTFYQRLAEIKWLKNNAIFNFTQLVTWMKKNQLTDGKILLDFPLTSRHIGLLAYKYESSDMKADGQSSLLYNGDTIMSGNYTRDSEFTAKRNKDKIIINVNNSFMPAGIIYNHKLFFLDPGSKWNSQDIKRIELFRLNDRSNFSIVGEIQFQENKDDKLTTFKAFHSRRKFIFEKLSEGKSKSITTANFTLKPNVWCATGFKLIDKDSVNGQEIQFNISYPRRLFTLNIDYVIDIDDLILEMTANPNLYSQAKHLTAIVRFNRKPIDNYHLMSIEIAHPYLVQNISAILSYLKNENVLANLNLSLEYANDINRKVILNMKSEKVVGNATKFYIFNVYAIHPASRLKITGYGNLRMGSKLLVFNKNITYSRSYMPLQFWITNAELNILKKLILIERKSLRDSSYLKAMFGKTGSSRYWANATLLKDKNFTVGSDFYIDIDGYKTELNMNFTPDASNRLRMLGAYNDHRDLKLIIWRTIYTFDVYDFKILARLNNSRMLTSSIKWRPEIYSEIMDLMQSSTNYIWNYAIETANFWTQYIRMESMDTLTDIWYDARPVLQDFLIDIRDLKHLQQDLKYFEKLFNDSYDANEFFMQDIYSMYQALTEEISFRDKMSHVPKIVNELWEVMGETSETIRQSVLWAVQSLKSIYEKIVEFLNGLATGETMDMISQYLQKIAAKYDKIIKDMHIKFLNYMEELWNETGNVIAQYWMKTLRTIEPAFIQLAHHIEAFFWQGSKRVIEFLYEKQSELMKSAVFRSNSNFTKDLEKFYDDITKNDFWTNMRKYSKMLYDIVTEKYFASVPFGYELNEIGTEIVGEIKELYNLPFIKFTVQIGVDVYDQVIWLYKYLNVEEKVQVVIPVIYNVIKNYSHTALDNEMINHPSSTKFIFKPESGEIYLEQKLPIPWHAFNLTPNFAEIPEYKRLVTLHSYIAPTNRTFWTYYYYFAPLLDPSNWLPPFSAQAMIIGGKHIVTFDGISYELEDCNCSYLLAKEFVFGTFSLALIDNNSDQPDIALIAYDKTLYFDFLNDVISLDNNQVPSLPLLINDIHIYAQEGLITVRSSKGFFLRCNFKFNVCTLRLSGWYFGKVAGLLGTMDNEPTTDFTTSNNNIVKNVDLFTKSWALESCTKSKNHQKYNKIDNKKDEECKKLFSSKNSSFVQCFTFVDPQPYYSMCLTSAESSYGDFICTAAYAYIQACGYNYIPIKIPTYCVQCPINEGFLEEGDFVILNGESVTQSTDVVFIVEAKSCNEYMRERRIVSTFSSILTKEFDTIGLHDNRYAVIAYGGTGIFDHPRSILVNNQIFTHAKDLSKYFEKIISGNGNTDIFGALRFATKLQFRPTVSKTFILMPCSDCDLTNMTVEYNVLNQEFIEKNITLHILMNADFDLEKLRVNKMFYGLDSERAYTKNDFKILKGDIELRRQIKLTKSMMGYCTTLALETNGTIFTGKKMGSENMALVKKFSSVFARRISATAQPDSCQTCECSSDDDGIEYIDCLPCTIPIPAYTDIDFRDNGTLSLLQAFEHASDII
ncbi:hypothetical protein O3M35_003911 [Rhynocoris fuscipes]|uniref:VWFD domain-containing protein n=1 Tax=Rhynocoris fuscipes TaxID=488301 RepID=A0AAW1CKM9_9HEMI